MKEFDTPAFRMIVHDNLLKEVKVKRGVTYSEKDVWESRDLSLAYIPGAKFFVLFEGEENSSVSAAARSAAATEEYYQYVAALALFGNRMLESIMGNLFLKINKPKVPTRFFDNREQAIEWLKQKMISLK
ncbi:MAG: hypothetical protein PSX36_03485 [bacterium]|nr:hypothetical protein [bacterium]